MTAGSVILLGLSTLVEACGDPVRADSLLKERVAGFRPGMSFDAVREKFGDPAVPKEYWGEPPRRDVFWLLEAKDGRHAAGQDLSCDFDDQDLLVSCRPGDNRLDIQLVPLAEWNSIRKGMRQAEVISLLCLPEDTQAATKSEKRLRYTVKMPAGSPFGTCFGTVIINKDRVARTDLRCL